MLAELRALGPWAADPRVAVAVSGADPDRAEAAARRLVGDGAAHLISWGIAGGLAGDLPAGQVIRPGAVILPDGTRVELSRGSTADVAILGVDRVVADPAEKRHLRETTGAIALDMESHRMARVSLETGAGLTIVRAVSDPYDRALPALAAVALGPDGRPRLGRVLAGLLRRPHDLPALIRAGSDSRKALAALRRFAEATPLDAALG